MYNTTTWIGNYIYCVADGVQSEIVYLYYDSTNNVYALEEVDNEDEEDYETELTQIEGWTTTSGNISISYIEGYETNSFVLTLDNENASTYIWYYSSDETSYTEIEDYENTSEIYNNGNTLNYYNSGSETKYDGYYFYCIADGVQSEVVRLSYDSENSTYVLTTYATTSTADYFIDETVLTMMNKMANSRAGGAKTYNYDELIYSESWGSTTIEEELSISISFTKTLSTEDDDMAYVNVGAVNELHVTEASTSAEVDSTVLVKRPKLPIPSNAYITISPPTGNDKQSVVIYVIIGAVGLIILSAGIIIIKKKIL